MKNSLRTALVVVLSTVVVAACGDAAAPAGDTGVLGSVASEIVNGENDTSAHDSIVLLLLEPNGKLLGSCTGTVVAPNLVLTARHCVSDTDESMRCKADGSAYEGGTIKSDYAPSALYVYTGPNAIYNATAPSKAAARGKVVVAEKSSVLCNHDIAFLVLDHDLDVPVAPIRTASGAVVGESMTTIGWGLTEVGKLPGTRQVRSGVKVTFAGPLVADKATGIGLGDSEFAVGESICSGDSGGPSISSKGAVVGVVSRGGGGPTSDTNPASACTGDDVVNEYTELAKKSDLVTQAFATAGYAPRLEGASSGVGNGASCAADDDCNSQQCVGGSCVPRCDDASVTSCASGTSCTSKDDVKVCLTPSQVSALALAQQTASASSTSASSDSGCASAPGRADVGGGALLAGLAALALHRRRSGRKRRADR